jgi:pimeloyl-ACP methyl ester carboxylesterase
MANIVLVHGMTGGGWQFSQVARLLRRGGHEVYAVTLTGCGERVHLANPDIDLDTHIMDVVNLIRYEELQDVVLLGTSYGGIVVTGVAERIPERLREIVYLDVSLPEDGLSALDKAASSGMAGLSELALQAAREQGDGWRVPADQNPADWNPASGDPPRTTPHPLKTLTQPIRLGNPAAAALPRTYIACTDKPGWGSGQAVMEPDARRARELGWRCHELHTGHTPHLTHPNTLAELLLALIQDD